MKPVAGKLFAKSAGRATIKRRNNPTAGLLFAALGLGWPLLSLAATPPEAQLVQALDAVQQGKPDALEQMQALVEEKPNFRLAQMIYADLLRAQAGAPNALAVESGNVRLVQLIEEARSRWTQSQQADHPGLHPQNVPRLNQGEPMILVDLSHSRLYLLRGNKHNEATIQAHFYAGIGVAGIGKQVEGDGKTPLGLYHITGEKTDTELPDFYGAGALVLDYPNRLDREAKRTGGGIWIHGVPPNTYTRAPRSSQGCITVSNEDFTALRQALGVSSSVLVQLVDHIDWVKPAQAHSAGLPILKAMDAWRRDWASGDVEQLLAHYAPDYQDAHGDRAEFAATKARVNANKRYIQVHINDITVLAYPERADRYLVRFRQRYESDNFRDEQIKEQLWQKRSGRWQIWTEGVLALQ